MRHEILRSLLFIYAVSALIAAAAPAPAPRRARRGPNLGDGDRGDSRDGGAGRTDGRGPEGDRPGAESGPAPGRIADLTEPPLPAGTTGARRHRTRYRGRRGGVNWARHGGTDRRTLIIGQLNIQSIKPKLPDLRAEINNVYGFHVLGLCETWLTDNVPNRLLNVPGYRLYRADRPKQSKLAKGHGGVAILAHESVNVAIIPKPVTENQEQSNLEIIWAQMQFGNDRQFLYASAYRHPTNTVQQLTADLDDLNAQLNFMRAANPCKLVILAGDFNACLLKGGHATPGARLLETLRSNGLVPVNRKRPTYRPAASLIDVVATSQSERVVRAGVTRCHLGGPHDYTRLMIRQGCDRRAGRGVIVHKRCLSRIDATEFNVTLSRADWNEVWMSGSTEAAWEAFVRVFTCALDTVAPMRRVRVSPPGAPPVTAATRDLLASRRRALADTSAAGRERYRAINRQCRAAIRSDTVAYLESECRKAGPAKMWRVLKPVIGGNKGANDLPRVTPNALNAFFSQIGQTTSSSVPRPSQPMAVRLPRVHTSGFRVDTVDIDTLMTVVHGMKPSTSTGVQGISVQMFQKFFYGVGPVLLNVINSSLISGEVPKSWKHAVITPLPKTANASTQSHYRPLSILPAIMKVMEKIVQRQLVQYFRDNCLFTPNQHGYRASHSSETALAVVTERIYRGMDEGCISILVMLDLSKCFDTVDHHRLIAKLALYGIDVNWFTNYLAGHSQQVKVSGTEGGPIMSDTLPNSIGVYQGGSLSCLLYAIYVNDMGLYVDGVEIIQFADDTQLLISGQKRHLSDMIVKLERALCQLSDWFNENRLKVNASKTHMIVFGTKAMLKKQPNISVNFCGTAIQESRVVKNLGLYMDRHMTFVDHVDHVVAKCSGSLVALTHARHSLPRASLKPIVTALVMTIIRYCVSIYGTCSKTELHRIQKIINFGARVISGKKKFDHISEVLKSLNWLSSSQLAQYHRAQMVRRVVSLELPETLYSIIAAADHRHEHQTRHNNQMRLPAIRTETGRRQLAYSGVKLYNDVCQKRLVRESFRTALYQTIRAEPG